MSDGAVIGIVMCLIILVMMFGTLFVEPKGK